MITTKKGTNGGAPAQSPGVFGDSPFTRDDSTRFADLEIKSPVAPAGGLGPKAPGEVPHLERTPYTGPQGDKKKSA